VGEVGKLTDDSTASEFSFGSKVVDNKLLDEESSIDIEVFVGHSSVLPERL